MAGPAGAVLLVGLGALALVPLVRSTGLAQSPAANTFALTFTGIAVEALPFVLLGAVVSGLIAVVVPARAFARVARLPLGAQVVVSALGGAAMPVCECGSVPVARRLAERGLHPAAAFAFMLSAPVINPVALFTTYLAYSGLGLGVEMTVGRAALGLLTAVTVGLIVGLLRSGSALRASPAACSPAHGHAHEHATSDPGSRLHQVAVHATGDFTRMGAVVVVGCALAALFQTAVPSSAITGLAGNLPVAVGALMILAFLLSLCSEADAFVAVSLPFSVGPQLGFLAFGPVADLKLTLLYGAAFGRRVALQIVAFSAIATASGAMWFELVVR